MHEVLPESLARSRRGICPTCGASLELTDSTRGTTCGFCGSGATLQYRLREVEGSLGTLKSRAPDGDILWVEKTARFASVACPGCGAEFETDTEQSLQTCRYCGTQSKLESRLLAITTDDVTPPARRSAAEAQGTGPWDARAEQMVWRAINEPNLLNRLHFVLTLSGPLSISAAHTTAHFLPWLLEHSRRDDPAFGYALGEVIGGLVEARDETRWPPVIQACRGALFDLESPSALLHGLARGNGVCVKTLIDVAEFASRKGAEEYTRHALSAVGKLIVRNRAQHRTIAEILAYRLFHVTGTVLGWTLFHLRGGYVGSKLDWPALWRACDELGHDRPELVQHVLATMRFKPAKEEAEYRELIGRVGAASSWAGRAAAAERLVSPPGRALGLQELAVQALDPLLDDPRTEWSAVQALCGLLDGMRECPPALQELARRRGESLPEFLKWSIARKFRKLELLKPAREYGNPPRPKRPLDPAVQAAVAPWGSYLNDSLSAFMKGRGEQTALFRKAQALNPPLFSDE
jgi:DNA-directed RNA polymerase subunit RPC12/RpoP